ncbi:hypothetical protein CWI37_0328p0010 [Hamiltosporidium tvaerminnensis]|uniref:Uncharacterized protein n=1 Tax=Hamiltosporidium tvaerminnensis TaxID=1176355 RepID=A0A4Q9L8H9_9MICR|nr:hypothetical protein CWI37_0328p0010 [Hamiltosporidium tvaerminnensis]
MSWDGIVTKYHKSHLKRLEIPMNVEAYMQSIVLKKTVETISFDRRRGLELGINAEESWERASMGVIMRAEMHEEPTPPLKEAKREKDKAKNFKPKNKAPIISQGATTLEKPTNNINKESDLEEETKVAKEVEEKILMKRKYLGYKLQNKQGGIEGHFGEKVYEIAKPFLLNILRGFLSNQIVKVGELVDDCHAKVWESSLADSGYTCRYDIAYPSEPRANLRDIS